jgi:23S rRNA pseudouridine2605 synthase
MRLQRFLARAGLASRRGAEELIRGGRVRVNGEIAQLGMSVDPSVDDVMVGRRRVSQSEPVWMALNKPVGHVVSRKDTRGRPTVFELVPAVPGLTYVGRLDVLTSGLLLLTTDGDLANRLTHPRYEVEKEYRVRVRGKGASSLKRALDRPIELDDRPVKIIRARVRSVGANRTEIELVLTEGRHRIVRRVCDLFGLEVEELARVSHGPIRLGRLPVGSWRYLSGTELNAIGALRIA